MTESSPFSIKFMLTGQRRRQPSRSGGVRMDGGPGAKPLENFLGPRPLRLWETPILKIEIRPFEYRDTPFFG